MTSGWSFCSHIPLHAISAVKVLTDVSSNALPQNKLATRMLAYKVFDVDDEVVENDELLADVDTVCELLAAH